MIYAPCDTDTGSVSHMSELWQYKLVSSYNKLSALSIVCQLCGTASPYRFPGRETVPCPRDLECCNVIRYPVLSHRQAGSQSQVRIESFIKKQFLKKLVCWLLSQDIIQLFIFFSIDDTYSPCTPALSQMKASRLKEAGGVWLTPVETVLTVRSSWNLEQQEGSVRMSPL